MAGDLYEALMSRQTNPTNGPTRWNSLPMSSNVDDRRGGGLYQSLMDSLHGGYLAMTGNPLLGGNEGSKSRVTGSPYAEDIANTARMIQFQSTLNKMGRTADNRVALNAYFDQNEAAERP